MKPKYKAFADTYLQTGNATQSAISAGYPANTAAVTGHRLLKNDNIRKYIDNINANIAQKTADNISAIYTTEQIADKLQIIADTAAKPSDRLRALELLGKYRSMFTDQTRMVGDIEIAIKPAPPVEAIEGE